jgi:hypothetical protein
MFKSGSSQAKKVVKIGAPTVVIAKSGDNGHSALDDISNIQILQAAS